MRAARWVAASRLVIEVGGLAASIVLARLLTPAEFGRAVVVLAVVPVASILLTGVISPLLVQRRDLTDAHLQAASALALAAGAVMTALTLAAAPLLALLIDARTGELLAILAPTFLLAAPAVVPDAQLRRRLEFRVLGVVEIAASATGLLTTVLLAALGAGEEALVIGALSGVLTGTVALCAARRPARPRWRRAEARELLAFGVPAGVSAIGALFVRQVDYLIVGARLGPAATGAYWRAYQLGAEYQTKLTTVMLRVAFPLYSRLTDLEELLRVRRRIVRLHAVLIVPGLSLLVAVAPVAVPFVFGDQWRAAVVPTQLLAFVGMLNGITTGIGPLLMAVGRIRALTAFTWAAGAGYAVVIFLAAPHGIDTVAAAALGYTALAFFASHEILLRRTVGISSRDVLAEAWPAFAVGAAIIGVCTPLRAALEQVGAVPALAACVAAAGALYVLLLPRLAADAWADLRALLARRVKARG